VSLFSHNGDFGLCQTEFWYFSDTAGMVMDDINCIRLTLLYFFFIIQNFACFVTISTIKDAIYEGSESVGNPSPANESQYPVQIPVSQGGQMFYRLLPGYRYHAHPL
jgi:hypothetical protein